MAICVELRRGEATKTITSWEELEQILREEKLAKDIAEIRASLKQADNYKRIGKTQEAQEASKRANYTKSQLPGFIFQCSTFTPNRWVDKKGVDHGTDRWRNQANGVLNGLFMVDFDHIGDPRKVWQEMIDKGVLERWQVLMAFVTSSDEGLKIAMVTNDLKKSLFQHQTAFSREFGLECDERCKDSSRLSFCPSYDDVLFVDPAIISAENMAFAEKWQGRYEDGSADQELFPTGGATQGRKRGQKTEATAKADADEEVAAWIAAIARGEELTLDEAHEQMTYDEGGPRIVDIISLYIGGEQPGIGKRHDTLLNLASDLRYVLENDLKEIKYYLYRLPFVQDLVKLGRDTERTINDGYDYQYNKSKPKKLQAILEQLAPEKEGDGEQSFTEDDLTEKFGEFGRQFEALFKYYPCMEEVCYDFEAPSFPALIFCGGALFGTLATRTWYHFYHKPERKRRLNYCIFVIADPASQKSSIGDLFETILSPIIAQDEVYDQQINDYKKKTKNREQQAKKDRDKEGVTYPTSKSRIHGTRTANNIFIEDMVNNVEEIDGEQMHLHLFTYDAELDSATAASKGGQWIDKSMFELKAFHNEMDNQQYRNIDSYTGKFKVYWNFIYTGTPFSLNKKVNSRNYGSGLDSRLAVIPLASEKFKMMPLSTQSKQNLDVEKTLKDWAYKLDETSGELPIWPLVEVTWHWTNDIMTLAGKTKDEVAGHLCRRVPYYGLNVAAPYILMRHWEEWTKDKTLPIDDIDKQLVELIMEVQYFSQKFYFGKFAKEYYARREEETAENSPYKVSDKLLDYVSLLPEKFQRTDVEQALDISKAHANRVCARLEVEGFVEHVGKGMKTYYIKKGSKKK